MAFNDLQLKVAAESAVLAAHANIAKLSLFAKSYSELAGRPGEAIAVPVYDFTAADEFNKTTNNYGSGANEVAGAVLNLDQHIVKSVSIDDVQLAETGINWVKDAAAALADSVTRYANKAVFEKFDGLGGQLTATNALTTKTLVADLYKTAAQADIPVDKCVVVLTPAKFATVLSMLDSNVYGGTEAIRTGVIEGLYGFKGFVCSTFLPEGVDGVIAMEGAVGTAARYLAPMTPGAYPEAFSATDPDNGLTIGFRRYMNLDTGSNLFAADMLFGAKVLQPTKVVVIKNA